MSWLLARAAALWQAGFSVDPFGLSFEKGINGMLRVMKTPAAVVWTGLVIAMLAAAIWVNGGFGLHRSPVASSLVIIALLGSSLLAFGSQRIPGLQRVLLREGVDRIQVRGTLRFIALFSGLLGLGILLDTLLR